jgi:hypothetical protein
VGCDTYRQATIVSTRETVEEAYAELDRIAEKLAANNAPANLPGGSARPAVPDATSGRSAVGIAREGSDG